MKAGQRVQSRASRRTAVIQKVWDDGTVTLRFPNGDYKDYSEEQFKRLYFVK